MRSLNWPYPSVLAGSLRTILGKRAQCDFTENDIDNLKQIEISGPFPMVNDKPFFPAPKDLQVLKSDDKHDSKKTLITLRPSQFDAGEGNNLSQTMQPVLLTRNTGIDGKPVELPAFWSRDTLNRWLCSTSWPS